MFYGIPNKMHNCTRRFRVLFGLNFIKLTAGAWSEIISKTASQNEFYENGKAHLEPFNYRTYLKAQFDVAVYFQVPGIKMARGHFKRPRFNNRARVVNWARELRSVYGKKTFPLKWGRRNLKIFQIRQLFFTKVLHQ